jgi:colanic acid biosynthesis glycosyl transferase WcaI
MASARPILAVAPAECEISSLVRENDCGVSILPEQPGMLAEAILRLRCESQRLTRMGENGRTQLENRFSRSRCVEMYEQMLLNIRRKG